MRIQENRSDHSRAQGIVPVTQASLPIHLGPDPSDGSTGGAISKRARPAPPSPWSQGQPMGREAAINLKAQALLPSQLRLSDVGVCKTRVRNSWCQRPCQWGWAVLHVVWMYRVCSVRWPEPLGERGRRGVRSLDSVLVLFLVSCVCIAHFSEWFFCVYQGLWEGWK